VSHTAQLSNYLACQSFGIHLLMLI
jgi:hypothetical protein